MGSSLIAKSDYRKKTNRKERTFIYEEGVVMLRVRLT